MERIRQETEKLKWPVYERGKFDRGSYSLDLASLGNGAFSCETCGRKIDPDDRSESNYVIIGTHMKNDDLESLDIGCRCRTIINIKGFIE